MTLDHYLRHRRAYEIGLWALFFAVQVTANVWVTIFDHARAGLPFARWEPAVWEISSVALWAVLLPAILWFDGKRPLRYGLLRRHVPLHLLFTIPVSLVHVAGMVVIRKAVYAAAGGAYVFGDWGTELFYEYLKDFRTYAAFIALIYLYRFILVRLQGEASLLVAPDDGEPLEPVERPERLLVRKLGKEFLIAVRDIEWLEASGNYVNLHLGQRAYPYRGTMTSLEQRLDPAKFRRTHRSYAVNLDFVREIEPLDTGDARIRLSTGAVVPLSRRYRTNLTV
jgi:hypothetical protein